MSHKTMIIVNPSAAEGGTGKRWDKIEAEMGTHFEGEYDVEFTEARNHATDLARTALKQDYEMIVALGGDGTINEVANGFFADGKPVKSDAVLGILSVGTAGDFIKTLDLPSDLQEAIKILNGTDTRTLDIGKTSFVDLNGDPAERYFVNVAEFGSGGAVVEKVSRTTKFFGARIAYLWGILSTLSRYENTIITYKTDDSPEKEEVLNDFIIANGRYYGGGLKPAPDAEPDDGLFDIVTIGDIGFLEVVTNLRKFTAGTHLSHPKINHWRAKRVEASSEGRVLIEMDGDAVGTLPASFEILPSALKVRA